MQLKCLPIRWPLWTDLLFPNGSPFVYAHGTVRILEPNDMYCSCTLGWWSPVTLRWSPLIICFIYSRETFFVADIEDIFIIENLEYDAVQLHSASRFKICRRALQDLWKYYRLFFTRQKPKLKWCLTLRSINPEINRCLKEIKTMSEM